MKHLDIVVKGRVQGVFYRNNTRKKAQELGVKGIVRNEPDGTVYIEAEGEAKAVEALTEWCKQGPPKANVSDLSIQEGNIQGYRDFDVVRR